MHLADAFIQSDLQYIQVTHSHMSMCVPWESNPQPSALLTQCSTTEPHRNNYNSTTQMATLLNERTNQKNKSLIMYSRNEKVHFYIKVSVAFCNFIFSADTDWEEITGLLTNN